MTTETLPATCAPPSIRTLLERSADRLRAALPQHLTPERMIQVATLVVYRTPKLQECDPNTILASVMRAATLGLDLDPALGEAYLVPRWNSKARVNECQCQIGYQGLRKLAMQSGKVRVIEAVLVHELDHFEFRRTPEPVIEHVPFLAADRGAAHLVYAYGKLATGEVLAEVMTASEIEAVHARSESARNAARKGEPEVGPWVSDWGEMARKTVLRRLCKALPRSPELAEAIREEAAPIASEGTPGALEGTPEPRPVSRSAELARRLAPQARALPVEPSEPEGEEDSADEDLRVRPQARADAAKPFGVFLTDTLADAREFFRRQLPAGVELVEETGPNVHQVVRHLVKWANLNDAGYTLSQADARRLCENHWRSGEEARVAIREEVRRYLKAEFEELMQGLADEFEPEVDAEIQQAATEAAERN